MNVQFCFFFAGAFNLSCQTTNNHHGYFSVIFFAVDRTQMKSKCIVHAKNRVFITKSNTLDIFRLHISVSFFFFFSNRFQFRICSLLMKISDMPSAFSEFEALYLKAYWLERSNFLKTCTARLPFTILEIFDVRKIFAEKLFATITRKR